MITPFPYIAKTNAVQDIVGVVTENPLTAGLNATYAFVSYGDAQGSTELATGTASVTGINTENYFEILVETNSVDGFVGKRYWVSKDAKYGDDNLYQLYADGEGATGTGMYVKIDLIYTSNVMPKREDAEPTPEPEPEPTVDIELAPDAFRQALDLDDDFFYESPIILADKAYEVVSMSLTVNGQEWENTPEMLNEFAPVTELELEDTTWNDKYSSQVNLMYDFVTSGEYDIVLNIETTEGTATIEYTYIVNYENEQQGYIEMAPQELVTAMGGGTNPEESQGYLIADKLYTVESCSAVSNGTHNMDVWNYTGNDVKEPIVFQSVAELGLDVDTWDDLYIAQYETDIPDLGENNIVMTIVTTDGTYTVEYQVVGTPG